MKFRRYLTLIIGTFTLAGLATGGYFYFGRRECKGGSPDERFLCAVYQNWREHHGDIIKTHGEPSEFTFVDIRFQNFVTGYMTYDLTRDEAIIYYGHDNKFERIRPLPEGRLVVVNFDLIEERFNDAMERIPPGDKETYRSLVYNAVNKTGPGIAGGFANLYLERQLLKVLGRPLADQQRLGIALYARGKNYDLIAGLPIGGDPAFHASNREGIRRIVVLYSDNHFEDHKELPPAEEKPSKFPFLSKLSEFYDKHRQSGWFWLLSILVSVLVTYILGMAALLLLARKRGSVMFSRTFLVSVATKPLLIAPVLGRWALLLGYERRLLERKKIKQVSKEYFGIPAEDSIGLIPWSPTGDTLHERIAQALGPQQPVLLIGKGGAGKSTILRRLTYLAIEHRLPFLLKGFTPLLIPASYYNGTLTQAIAHTLRGRYGVAVDEEIIKCQLQSGEFLILFDGVSEAIVPMQQALEEILRTARHADYRNCRFIISTRPPDWIPPEVSIFTLRPLNLEVIPELLEHSELDAGRRNQVLMQLKCFGQRPIDPLLFSMFLKEYEDQQVSCTRSQVYQRYFRELLRVREDDSQWLGWLKAAETLALHTLIHTGRRGIGLPHEQLMNLLDGRKAGGEISESLSSQLRRLYHLPVSDELDLLNQLKNAGLLLRGRRWSFAHDTFEEFFAASYIVSYFDLNEEWPSLGKWQGSQELEQAFSYVLEFVREMIDEADKVRLMRVDLPQSWRRCLTATPDNVAQR